MPQKIEFVGKLAQIRMPGDVGGGSGGQKSSHNVESASSDSLLPDAFFFTLLSRVSKRQGRHHLVQTFQIEVPPVFLDSCALGIPQRIDEGLFAEVQVACRRLLTGI